MSDAESPLADVDPIVRGLLPGYLARRREELATLAALLAEKRYTELGRIGHNLSGSGGAYGLQGLTDIGRSIELAADSADDDRLAELVAGMSEFLDRVGNELA